VTRRESEAEQDTDIATLASQFAVVADPAALARLRSFVVLFAKWNRSINLASVRSDDELIARHLIDSFALAALAGPSVESAADVGSGGGLPGIPLAVLMGATRFTLFEPNRKKVAFLRTAVRELDLGARVTIEAQAVEIPVAVPWRARFDLALSRATLAPPAWLELGRELVRPAGQIAVFTAGASGAGLPPTDVMSSYGEGRQLLLFRR